MLAVVFHDCPGQHCSLHFGATCHACRVFHDGEVSPVASTLVLLVMPAVASPLVPWPTRRQRYFQSLVCFSANPGRDWTPAFASLDDPFGLLHKLVRASDLTVCLDRYCAPDPTGRRQVQAFEVGWYSVITDLNWLPGASRNAYQSVHGGFGAIALASAFFL